MGHRSGLVLHIDKNDAAFHQVCDVDMHERLAIRSEYRSFSFCTHAPLGIAEKFAMNFKMDVVSIGQKLVILFNHIGRERQAGIAGRTKGSGGYAAYGSNLPDYNSVARAYDDSASVAASFNTLPRLNRINGHGLSMSENGK